MQPNARARSSLPTNNARDAPGRTRQKSRTGPVSLRPSGRGSATKEQPLGNYFEVRFRTEKYVETYFSAESEALAERPAEEGLEGQEPRGTSRVEDLNIQVIRSYSWAAAESPKKLVR
jgi:hypothetical protein